MALWWPGWLVWWHEGVSYLKEEKRCEEGELSDLGPHGAQEARPGARLHGEGFWCKSENPELRCRQRAFRQSFMWCMAFFRITDNEQL